MWCEATAMQCNVRPCRRAAKRTNEATEPARRLVTSSDSSLANASWPASSAQFLAVVIVIDARDGDAGWFVCVSLCACVLVGTREDIRFGCLVVCLSVRLSGCQSSVRLSLIIGSDRHLSLTVKVPRGDPTGLALALSSPPA